jgi:20S proteasome subunit beta 2
MLRNVVMPNVRVAKEDRYVFRRGTTAWKKEEVRNLVVDEHVTVLSTDDSMDTS